MIERAFTAERVNAIANDPSVYPLICGNYIGPFDLTRAVNDQNNVFLIDEHGCMMFIKHQPGTYECHTNVLPAGRGKWALEKGAEAFNWMFTKTDAFEVMTKCPQNNIPAKVAARKHNLTLDFTTRPLWPVEDKFVSIDVYSIRIQEWARHAKGLVEKGKWFHNTLEEEYSKRGIKIEIHDEDEVHDRYVGGAVSMIEGGQVAKAINFYNRWAKMSGYVLVKVVSVDPLIVDISEAKLRINSGSFEVL